MNQEEPDGDHSAPAEVDGNTKELEKSAAAEESEQEHTTVEQEKQEEHITSAGQENGNAEDLEPNRVNSHTRAGAEENEQQHMVVEPERQEEQRASAEQDPEGDNSTPIEVDGSTKEPETQDGDGESEQVVDGSTKEPETQNGLRESETQHTMVEKEKEEEQSEVVGQEEMASDFSDSDSSPSTSTESRGAPKASKAKKSTRSRNLSMDCGAIPENDLYHMAKPLLSRRRRAREDVCSAALQNIRDFFSTGASVDKWAARGTPLMAAIKYKSLDFTRILLQSSADPSIMSGGFGPKGTKTYPVHVATYSGNLEICKMLLNSQADVNVVDMHGQTPLFFSASPQICDLLSVHGADVDVINKHGQTCLHPAAKAGLIKVLSWLASRCSKKLLQLKDRYGACAAYYAREAGIPRHALLKMRLVEPTAPIPKRRGRNALDYSNDFQESAIVSGPELRTSQDYMVRNGIQQKTREKLPSWLTKRLLVFSESGEGVLRRLSQLECNSDDVKHAQVEVVPECEQCVLDQLRTKLKGALYARGDGGIDCIFRLVKGFKRVISKTHDQSQEFEWHDTDLNADEFRMFLRRSLHVPTAVISDKSAQVVFRALDRDASGSISPDELGYFMDPVGFTKDHFKRALVKRLEKCGADVNLLSIIGKRVGKKLKGGNSGPHFAVIMHYLDVAGKGVISTDIAVSCFRDLFDVGDETCSLEDLRRVLEVLEQEELGGIDVEELVDLIDFEREWRVDAERWKQFALQLPDQGRGLKVSQAALHRRSCVQLDPGSSSEGSPKRKSCVRHGSSSEGSPTHKSSVASGSAKQLKQLVNKTSFIKQLGRSQTSGATPQRPTSILQSLGSVNKGQTPDAPSQQLSSIAESDSGGSPTSSQQPSLLSQADTTKSRPSLRKRSLVKGAPSKNS